MNFVYLSPHFPANYKAFCIQLRRLGVNVLGIADAPYESLDPELREALTEYYRVDDLHRYDQLVQACRYFIGKYGPIDRLDSHAEYWLETEAQLRTEFDIPGIKTDTIATIKRKSLMKTVFQDAGVPVARGQVCRTPQEALAFIGEVGFPVVAKPDIGVGAAGTFKLHNPQEVAEFFSHKMPVDYFFEEFITGDIQSFDGLIDRDGVLRFFTAHQYSRGIMETVQEDGHIYYWSLRNVPPDLEEAGRNVLKAFGVKERFFHFEFFRTRENRLVALEVNMRPPGGFTTDMFNYANDFDIYREWANVVVHNRFEAEWSRPYHVVYVSRKYHLPYAHDHDTILSRYGHLICQHEPIPMVYSRALGHYGFIARSPHQDEIIEVAEYAQKLEPSP